jgi:uncharacterized caspase-like protein/ribosomal protein S27E
MKGIPSMAQLFRVKCPTCRHRLLIPQQWVSGLVRCKQCGQVMKMNQGGAPAVGTSSGNLLATIGGGLLLFALFAGVGFAAFHLLVNPTTAPTVVVQNDADSKKDPKGDPTPKNGDSAKQPSALEVQAEQQAGLLLATWDVSWQIHNNPGTARIDQPVAIDPPMPKPPTPDPAQEMQAQQQAGLLYATWSVAWQVHNNPATAKLDEPVAVTPPPPPAVKYTGAYPRRALLIGAKNYLYANPLNPGYVGQAGDPLGTHELRRALTTAMNFQGNQVAEFSDMAEMEPCAPLKTVMEDNIVQFLKDSRPQDRVLLVFVGHVVEVEEKGYLVPIDGDIQRVETLVPLEWLYGELGKCKARQKLVIMDVAHLDPEQGVARVTGGRLGDKLEEQLSKPPEGVQVWVSCAAGQQSYEFASSGHNGSVFMYFLVTLCNEMTNPGRRKALEEKLPGLREAPEASLPLAVLAAEVNRETTEYVKMRWKADQTPRLFGSEPPPRPELDPTANDPTPVPVAVKMTQSIEPAADPKLIDSIIAELKLADDQYRKIDGKSLPHLSAKNLEAYQADYTSMEEFKVSLEKHPLRMATLEASELLSKHDRSFRMGFVYPGDEGRFKTDLFNEQEAPAVIERELKSGLAKLEEAGMMHRDKEPSKRWQAHYDYILARYLAKMAWTREYNLVLGLMRKETPPRDKPESTGWRLVPQEKLQQKDTRDLDKRRKVVVERILADFPGTPWEFLARREAHMVLGLMPQEAKLNPQAAQPRRRPAQ